MRETFIFKIIPMLNPDGVIKGNYSKNNWNKWCSGWSSDKNDFLPFYGVILRLINLEEIEKFKHNIKFWNTEQ